MSRFSQAISEGDGISVIPVLEGDVGGLAEAAEADGAEAIAVGSHGHVDAVRSRTGLPVVVLARVRSAAELEALRASGADACVLVYEDLAGEDEMLEELYAVALELGLEVAVDVRDEDELEETLERIDPEIILLSERDPDKDEEELERTLDLLPDVPAGKLVISESRVVAREQVLALERAGVDALLLGTALPGAGFADALAVLTGRAA